MYQTIKAKDVKPGMSLFNKYAKHPAFQWVRVKEVRTSCVVEGRTYTVLVTGVYEEWKHPEEAVGVCTES